MFEKIALLTSIFSICTSNGAVLLWSNKNIEISPLNVFTDENLEDLVIKLEYPQVIIYRSRASFLPEFEGLLAGYHTSYNPNGDIDVENATEITGQDDLELLKAKLETDLSAETNVLSVLVIPNERQRRDASESSTTESSSDSSKEHVVYKGKSTKNIYSLLYSSQPLTLRVSNVSTDLGESVLVTINTQSKNASSSLDAQVPVGDTKYILKFFFTWRNSYWSLSAVQVKSTSTNNSSVNNLFISEPFSVPARFSYHCNGETVFTDVDKTMELVIYDIQAQPDSKDGSFGDAYDCVDFMTVPIWSGLFVSAILGAALIIALIAISEIRTMDKFDNQKTKQLVITVSE